MWAQNVYKTDSNTYIGVRTLITPYQRVYPLVLSLESFSQAALCSLGPGLALILAENTIYPLVRLLGSVSGAMCARPSALRVSNELAFHPLTPSPL